MTLTYRMCVSNQYYFLFRSIQSFFFIWFTNSVSLSCSSTLLVSVLREKYSFPSHGRISLIEPSIVVIEQNMNTLKLYHSTWCFKISKNSNCIPSFYRSLPTLEKLEEGDDCARVDLCSVHSVVLTRAHWSVTKTTLIHRSLPKQRKCFHAPKATRTILHLPRDICCC